MASSRSLLERSDLLARRMDVSRAELIARGLKAMLAAAAASIGTT